MQTNSLAYLRWIYIYLSCPEVTAHNSPLEICRFSSSPDNFGSFCAPAVQLICHFYFWNLWTALLKTLTTQLTLTPTPTHPHALFPAKTISPSLF